MGIREFYAQHMKRPGYEYIPDPLGRLGQGQSKKTAQGPEAPTPPKPPVVPKPIPPTLPKGPPEKKRSKPPRRWPKQFWLRDGVIIDKEGNTVPPETLTREEFRDLIKKHRREQIRKSLP